MANDPVSFDREGARRVGRATVRVENSSLGGTAPARVSRGGFVPQGFNAKTGAGGIPAMSGDTPGKATVRLWDYDSTDTLVDSGVDVDAYNTVDAAVAGNKRVTLLSVQGRLQVVVEPCT